MAPNPAEVFFESRYSYRRWIAIVFVAVLGTVDVIVLVAFCRHFPVAKPAPDQWLGLIFTTIWLLGTGIPVGWLAWRMAFHPTIQTRIDTTGITIDGKTTEWNQIDSIYGQRRSGDQITMHFLKRGRWPLKLIRQLPIAPLTQSQYEDFADRLSEYLELHFPEVMVD